MTDSHCHLDHMDSEEVAAAMITAHNFAAMLTIGTDFERNRKAVAFAETYPNVWAAVGLHPTEAHNLSAEIKQQLTDLSGHSKTRAIGETGLDYYWTPAG
jgi:TatD DNase family protein